MSRVHRISNLVGVVAPFLGLLAAIVLLWNRAVDWVDLSILLGGYLLIGFGVTIGYHRLLTHRTPTETRRNSQLAAHRADGQRELEARVRVFERIAEQLA
jgi:hypothetical protein